MDNTIKKVIALTLITMVILFTIIYILSSWGLIHFEISLIKILETLFVIFIASVVILFIYAVLYKQQFTNRRRDFRVDNDD